VSVKSLRQIAIADHLWEAFERMAAEMGSDRDALVNQAMHVFARLNGYLVPGAVPTSPPAPTPPAPDAPRPPPLESADRLAVAEQVLETAARLERDVQDRPPALVAPPRPRTGALVVVREDGAEETVAKDRYLIGRGKHCDLVIDSGKVSREHAALVKEGDDWFIEDLGSANGTWHRKARVQRRRIDDGDEFFICAERIRCLLR